VGVFTVDDDPINLSSGSDSEHEQPVCRCTPSHSRRAKCTSPGRYRMDEPAGDSDSDFWTSSSSSGYEGDDPRDKKDSNWEPTAKKRRLLTKEEKRQRNTEKKRRQREKKRAEKKTQDKEKTEETKDEDEVERTEFWPAAPWTEQQNKEVQTPQIPTVRSYTYENSIDENWVRGYVVPFKWGEFNKDDQVIVSAESRNKLGKLAADIKEDDWTKEAIERANELVYLAAPDHWQMYDAAQVVKKELKDEGGLAVFRRFVPVYAGVRNKYKYRDSPHLLSWRVDNLDKLYLSERNPSKQLPTLRDSLRKMYPFANY
jgi:hypothetical protein